MTNEEFLAEFGHIAEAPDGIARLRGLILDLAVRGRLAPQDPADEPASHLLERIAEERERLVAAKKIKEGKEATGADDDNGSCPVPKGWADVRVSDVGVVLRGVTYPGSDAQTTNAAGLIPLLRATNIGAGLDLEDLLFVPEGRVSPSQLLDQGDIVMCMSSGSASLVGKSAHVTPTATGYTFGAFCSAIKPILVGDYLALALRTPQVLRQLIDAGRGIGINNLRINDLRSAVVPLPPLAEQQRIVKRVDELMALCDELEEGQTKAAQLRAATTRSTLAKIIACDPSETDYAVTLINDHLRLTLNPGTGAAEVVTELRKAILDLAVRGRLVPQDPDDEPASVLLERISEERERLVAEKKIKKAHVGRTTELSGLMYTLAKGWSETSLPAIGTWAGGTGFPKSFQGASEGEYLFCKVGDMNRPGNERFVVTTENRVDQDAAAEMGAVVHQSGTVIFPKIGGAVATNKRRVLTVPTIIDNNCLGVSPFEGVLSAWLFIQMSSIDMGPLANAGPVPAVSQKILGRISIGLPPLAEQQRIVARVDELMALCDELEEGLLAERRVAAEFADSAVSALVAQVS